MIAIDINTVGNWAERRGLAYTRYTDLSQKPEVRGLIRDEIGRGNATLPDASKVRRFLLLTKDLEADDAEMTRTRKVRRRHVAEKYAPVIEAFYSGRREVELSTAITYEDGRQGHAAIARSASRTSRGPSPMSDDFGVLSAADLQRRADRADVLADRARLRARLQGDGRDQLRPGRVRDDRGLRGGGRARAVRGRRCGWPSCWRWSGMVGFGFALERVMLRKLIGRPVIAVVMATIGLASILRGLGPFVIFSGHQAAAAADPRGAVHPGAAVHPAHPAAGGGGEPGLPRRLRLVLPEVAQGHRHAGGGRQPAGRHGHGDRRRALLRRWRGRWPASCRRWAASSGATCSAST